ncbi:unnamed protein product, partial [Diabrotica balteata]
MRISVNKSNPPLGGLFLAEYVKLVKNVPLEISWGSDTVVENTNCKNSNDVARTIARSFYPQLYGNSALETTEVDNWLMLSLGPLNYKSEITSVLETLNKVLSSVTYLVGKRITAADFAVFGSLYRNKQWSNLIKSKSAPVNVVRWYDFIHAQEAVMNILNNLPQDVAATLTQAEKHLNHEKNNNVGNRNQEGKFVDLPFAEMGKVVVRFPPEASGYLHIGHAKAALLNQHYQEAFQGKLILRFDDTNPAKENVHFENVILEDVAMLQIKPDKFTYTSDYFDLMLQLCEKMMKEGNAYVDDTEPEEMKTQREQKIESVNRNNDVQKNFALWEEMKRGTVKGQKCCVRAKMFMDSPNGCLRDPTIYRCKNELHPRTGSKYKVYPTYDFACPIVDSIEGVTHVLRTMEYHDRDHQFYWFIEKLGLRKPHIWEYSRLSMTNTVLSKRKLTWFVNEGLVDGWDDPRMPTVRGVLRRGMTVQGLKEFIIAQGSSRSVVFMEWDKIWAFNKKVIDPIAPRYTAVDINDPVTVLVKGAKEERLSVPKHPKNAEVGNKSIWLGPKILIDRLDAEALSEGESTTFINWGNLLITKINRQDGKIVNVEAQPDLENTNYKKTLKLTWLAETDKAQFTPTWCVYFDHIISKPVLGKEEDFKQFIGHKTKKEVEMLGDPELKNLQVGDIIQLQRRGFFRVDVAYKLGNLHTYKEQAVILFHIPDGHAKESIPGQAVAKSKTIVNPKADNKVINISAIDLNNEIIKQGDIVRKLKEQKAAKVDIERAVKVLLTLKADYKGVANTDWKPGCLPPTVSVSKTDTSGEEIGAKITAQGDKVRQLKTQKADKAVVDTEVKVLLSLKSEYKSATGKDWNPNQTSSIFKIKQESISLEEYSILQQIAVQGDKVKCLKSKKADKLTIDDEVKTLLSLKADYKALTGNDWKPGTLPAPQSPSTPTSSSSMGVDEKSLLLDISSQGDVVRELKSEKADKCQVDIELKKLLYLKENFKNLTGKDWKPNMKPEPVHSIQNVTGESDNAKKVLTAKITEQGSLVRDLKTKKAGKVDDSGAKRQTRLGLEAKKEEQLSDWYSQVITKGELIEYYDVSGCYIFRPWSFAIWEAIKDWFDSEIKKLGVQNCYFPIFVSKAALEKEKTHIEDFAPEVAWVTKSGDSDMAEPIAVRPTSETVMYPAYAKWIQSYRDLPIKLNQWNNVVRWEFKHPQPFLRTREFLWQEGHTAFASKEEADIEVRQILDLYARVYTDLLAIPVVKGRKTEKEKFAGGDYTLTVEAYVSASGRAIQGATSHHLGQNFSKMFDITYEHPDSQEKTHVYQNSWGITTRTIGVVVMIHGDNQGLVIPPRVAGIQTVIVPCGITANLSQDSRKKLQSSCDVLETDLKAVNIRVKGDYRDNYSPGWKFNHWELKGVPVRIELGPKDIEKNQLVVVRRDTGEKIIISRADAATKIGAILEDVHENLYKKACDDLNIHKVLIKDWSQFCPSLDKRNVILAPFCGEIQCEDKIKADST